jgi:carboxyl-terminal processing protease
MPGRQPFAGEPHAVVVLPAVDPTLGGEVELLELERAEFEAELGTSVELVPVDPGTGPRWLLEVDPEHQSPPSTWVEPPLIISRAADVGGLFEAMSLLRTAVRRGEPVEATDCSELGEAIERVVEEVGDTYPAFALRGLDWDEICARHVDRVRTAEDPLAALQTWLAELEDGHTWARAPAGNLPYAVHLDDGATFVRVREETAGHAAGIRSGWQLMSIDEAPVDAAGWLARAAAPPHARALIAGRRLLAGPIGVHRTLTALSPTGDVVSWSEAPMPFPSGDLVTWARLASGGAYMRISAWIAHQGIDEAIDAALSELRACGSLILDLRGNPGGNLVLAAKTRARFLREPTALGSIRYSIGAGELSQPFPLVGEPAAADQRWPGRLVVLTDPLTFSASEDFLLGLQGLDHVTVVGQPSGGGSGRARVMRLLPGMTLMVSTALTYDREGHCVEGAGIPIDVAATGSDDETLALAATLCPEVGSA